MFRSILGFALFAALAFVALNIFFGILGGLFGLALWILKLAALGFILYFVVRLVSPSTADKIRDAIKGRPADAQRSHGSSLLECTCTILQPLGFCSQMQVAAARSPFASKSRACRAISCTTSGVPTAAVVPLGAR